MTLQMQCQGELENSKSHGCNNSVALAFVIDYYCRSSVKHAPSLAIPSTDADLARCPQVCLVFLKP